MWGHNIIFALRNKKKRSLNYRRYSLLFGSLSISKIDQKILNLRGLYQKRDLTVLQSMIQMGNKACTQSEKDLGYDV